MNLKLEDCPCPICEKKDCKILFSARDILYSTEGRFDVVKCSKCGLIRLNPRPQETDILKFYPLYEYKSYGLKKKSLLQRYIETLGISKKCKIVERISNRGNILDIGCGNGIFLRQMAKWGWNVSGIEINKAVVDSIPDRRKLNIKWGKLSDFTFADEYFDAITMWHVLEHLHYTGNTLENIRSILKKDGVLIVCCPDVDSMEAKLFGRYFSGFDVPRHLYDFSPRSLEALLETSGFTIIRKGTYFGSANSFRSSLYNLIKDKLKETTVKKILLKLIDNTIFIHIFYPFFYFQQRLNLGSVMTCYANKKQRL